MPAIGVILAGGLSRRMGGGDKGLRLVAGRPLLAHVIARLAPQCETLILNANGDPDRFSAFGLPVVPDSIPGFAGPLAGILAGLDWVAAHRPPVSGIVSVPADTPLIPKNLVARLETGRRAEKTEAACAASGGRIHPVIGLWPLEMRTALRQALFHEGERRVSAFFARHRLAVVHWPMEPFDPFFNANTPEDLARADHHFEREGRT